MYASRSVCWRCSSRMRPAVPLFHRRGASSWLSHPATDTDSVSSPTSAAAHRPASTARDAPKRHSRRPDHEYSAFALFNDVVQRQEAGEPNPGQSESRDSHLVPNPPQSRPPTATALIEWELAAKLKEISKSAEGPQAKLGAFHDDVWPQLQQFRGRIPKHLYVSTLKFLVDLCDAVAKQGVARTSLTLSKMLATLGKWSLDVRNLLVLNLCHILISGKHTSAERNALLEELVDMWKHLSQLGRRSQMNQTRLRFVLPSADEILDDALAPRAKQTTSPVVRDAAILSPTTTKALASIFIQFRIEQASKLVPALLATVAVLSDSRFTREGSRIDMAPLLSLVSPILSNQPAGPYVHEVFSSAGIRFPLSKLSQVQSYVAAQWPQAMDMMTSKDAGWRRHGGTSSHRPSPSSPARPSLDVFHKQVRAAYRARNTGAIVSIWQDLTAHLAQDPDLSLQLRGSPELVDFWIFVWCAVRRPTHLQETLDLMRQLHVQPTVRTYTSMMHGWKLCKDADRIEALWHKLVESGWKLDAVIWTERISSLIEAGRPQAGIQALAEMQSAWKRAVSSRGDDAEGAAAAVAVQPTTEVVNAAFKGLLVLDRHAAKQVLAWAGREGIQPNIRTFNILLRDSLSSPGSPEDVKSLLQTMKKQGVEPDAATFTIILEELLSGMETGSAAEQVQIVEQIFADMEAAGLRANPETYAKMLYAVASLPNGGSDQAVAAVQQHMRDAGLSVTAHMVTILLERTMSRDPLPPDTRATIGALLRQHNLTHVNQGDQTLWERVMSAYAVTGDVPSALAVFDDLARAARPVTSLPCLTDLLKALLAGGGHGADKSATDAERVVHLVLHNKLKNANALADIHGRDRRYWKHHFWFMARENGLIPWAEVPPDLASVLSES